ncbi:uncharacterized protein LAESUDRAFT_718618 [Laetiporus sulphureus 93-53]|uniref:F-box domain-containing protein n=1 Tax=Laetiporus sulphureus 93-53 TaxID=1314785 RepID=A0A165ART4_9APHY|nr:uncharacterized protein LAESUDRAFT_718618 [Laetiporus sulphureus 93-53]KZS99536.1 hypothetical protein LAESUDRAFT_718618 [Laetiporus sulphureus 93-53]
MSTFARAFPNVKRICLRQVTATLPSRADDMCWSHLDFLDMGNVEFRHPWIVTCKVRHLVLHLHRAVGSPKAPVSVIQNAMPVVLELEINLQLNAKFWKRVALVATRLRYLIIILKWDEESSLDEYSRTLKGWKSELPAFMHALKISCLRICCPSPFPAAQDILQDVPQALKHVIPTLCYVALEHHHSSAHSDWYDGRYDGWQSESTWWRITTVGNDKSHSKVATDIGERVDAYMKSAEFESSLAL